MKIMKHLTKKEICYDCNKLNNEENLLKFTIKDRNIDDKNTIFDGDEFTIYLCEECAKSLGLSKEWFDNELDYDYSLDKYKHELDILKIIGNFNIENQEYIYNNVNHLTESPKISREDWIFLNNYTKN